MTLLFSGQQKTCDAYDGNNRNIYLTEITYYYYLCSVAIFPTEPRLADSLSPPPVWEQNTSVIWGTRIVQTVCPACIQSLVSKYWREHNKLTVTSDLSALSSSATGLLTKAALFPLHVFLMPAPKCYQMKIRELIKTYSTVTIQRCTRAMGVAHSRKLSNERKKRLKNDRSVSRRRWYWRHSRISLASFVHSFITYINPRIFHGNSPIRQLSWQFPVSKLCASIKHVLSM